jgi:hypothetical protein
MNKGGRACSVGATAGEMQWEMPETDPAALLPVQLAAAVTRAPDLLPLAALSAAVK